MTYRSLSQQSMRTLSVMGTSGAICDNTAGLTGQQRRVCRLNPDVMGSVAYGAHLAVRECQKQFRNSRWNCSAQPRDASVFGKVTVQGHSSHRTRLLCCRTQNYAKTFLYFEEKKQRFRRPLCTVSETSCAARFIVITVLRAHYLTEWNKLFF